MKKTVIIIILALALAITTIALIVTNVDHVENGVAYIGKGWYDNAKIGEGISRTDVLMANVYPLTTIHNGMD